MGTMRPNKYDDTYYIHDLSMQSNILPVFLRPGDYRITLINYYGKRKSKNYEMVCRFYVAFGIY